MGKQFVYILLVVFAGCQAPSTNDKSTAIFSNYMQQVFNQEIDDSLHYYILVPQLACKSCATSTLKELTDNIRASALKKITFITNNKLALPDELQAVPILLDEANELDKLNLPIGNVTLIETQHAKVNFIKRFDGNDQTSILSLMEQ